MNLDHTIYEPDPEGIWVVTIASEESTTERRAFFEHDEAIEYMRSTTFADRYVLEFVRMGEAF